MPLTKLEREAITDSMLKIHSIQASLAHVDDAKLDGIDEIHECLDNADSSFRHALKSGPAKPKPSKH